MAELVVSIDGVQTQHVHLQKHRTTLGRRPHNDIVLANLSVSGMHCVFEQQQNEVWLKDVGSTNGTFINGQRAGHQRLADQDVIAIGLYLVRYLGQPAPAEAAHTAPLRLEDLGAPGSAGALHASMHVLSGDAPGKVVPLVKTVTTFGKPGEAVVAINHRRHGYYVALLEGGQQPAFHNGQPLGTELQLLADQDTVELAGSKFLFVQG